MVRKLDISKMCQNNTEVVWFSEYLHTDGSWWVAETISSNDFDYCLEVPGDDSEDLYRVFLCSDEYDPYVAIYRAPNDWRRKE